MNNYEKSCYTFIQNLIKELAQDYDVQYQHMEEFARWNLPEEIGQEWLDAEGMVRALEEGKCISLDFLNALKDIIFAFAIEFEKPNNPVWTHEAMKTSDFWKMQRTRAKRLLDEYV